jgi:uncharacterized protein (UPF0332 family)
MEPKEFLELAKQLLRNTTNEASLRTCVSRSYYALFNSMAQFICHNVEPLSQTAKDHENVYRYFYNCGIADVKTIASNLNDLRDERNDSDYKLHSDRFKNQSTVTLLFKKASITFNSFESIIQSSKRRKHIIKGIRSYKQTTGS